MNVFVIIEIRAPEVRGPRYPGPACSMGTMGNWIMTLGHTGAGQGTMPSIAIVIFVMLSGLILVLIIYRIFEV